MGKTDALQRLLNPASIAVIGGEEAAADRGALVDAIEAVGRYAEANAESLPYRDARFDNITWIGSLERMLDVRRALFELRRVGKTDARLHPDRVAEDFQ